MFIHILAPQFYLFQRGSNISRGGLPPHHCLCILRATPEVILVSSEASVLSGLLFPLHLALWAFAPVFYRGSNIHYLLSLLPRFLSGSLPFRSAPDWNWVLHSPHQFFTFHLFPELLCSFRTIWEIVGPLPFRSAPTFFHSLFPTCCQGLPAI